MNKHTSLTNLLIVLSIFILITIVSCENGDSTQFLRLEKQLERLLAERGGDLKKPVDSENASQVAGEDELVKISTEIIKSVSTGNINGAMDIIQKHSPLPEEEINKIREQTVQQLNIIKPRFGEFVGYEFIKSTKIGESIIRHHCIVKCENHIIRWEFIYYKPKEKWFLNTFTWDDQIKLILNG